MGTINALLPVDNKPTHSVDDPDNDKAEPAFSDTGDSTEKNSVIAV